MNGIVPPNETYFGLSYGQWAANWCNWLFSNLNQNGPVWFLRGNVDGERPVVMTSSDRVRIFSDLAIFFPIICSFFTGTDFSENKERVIKRKSRDQKQQTYLLALTIDSVEVLNLRNYFVTSPPFMLIITEDSPLRHYFELRAMRSEAVVTGYWILLKPLARGNHTIKFEGRHWDGFRTSGHYTLNVYENDHNDGNSVNKKTCFV